MDLGTLEIQGAHTKTEKYTPIATLKFIGGLQTQRSPFASLDNRYSSRFLGGKPDALIAGLNCEISNKLTLQRRPGLSAYGTVPIPFPDFYFSWQQASLANFVSIVDPTFQIYPSANLQLIVDTSTHDGTNAPGNIYNYSPTYAGIILNKQPASQQTSFATIANTMYMGDGVDLYKQVGANLLTQSNNYGSGITATTPWIIADTTLTTGQVDPTGASNASFAVFSSASTAAFIKQTVTPNYTPVASNTFTFSIWMKANTGAPTIFLEMTDSGSNVMANVQQTLSTSWVLYQITGKAAAATNSVTISINNPSSTSAEYFIYGAQLEVGGPATPTTITLNKPNGIYLWGIQAPTAAPTFTFQQLAGSTGVAWQPETPYSQTTLSLSSVAATTGLASPVIVSGTTYTTGAVYTGTITGGDSNAFLGRYFRIASFTNASNNSVAPGFLCLGSSRTTITLYNTGAKSETAAATATLLDTIIDSNGNSQIAYTPGTSGFTAPVWNPVVGQATDDGIQNIIAQTAQKQTNGSATTAYFPTAVTATSTKLIFVAYSLSPSAGTRGHTPTVTDSSGDIPVLYASASASNLSIFLYYVLSATAGTTNIAVTNGGDQATWVGIAEISHQTATDGDATNHVQMSPSVLFTTGSVSTTNEPDVLVTFGTFAVVNNTQGLSIGNLPNGFSPILTQAATAQGTGFWNMSAGLQVELATGSFNPSWLITNPTTNSNNGYLGITAAFKSSVGKLVWYNNGPVGLTSTSALNYQYGFSYVNTYTGHRSNMSPLSLATGAQAGVSITVTGSGCPIPTSGTGAAIGTGDPQVDAIEVYRNTDGGGFWYQIPPSLMQSRSGTVTDANGTVYLANPGTSASAGTWSFVDTVSDAQLNTQIYAPVAFLNTPPPAGATNLAFFDGRLWMSVGNILYYSTGPDDAALLNILQNGVSAESVEPTNYASFDAPIVRSVPTTIGLFVFTTTDVWVVPGGGLANYVPRKALVDVGLGNYNSIAIDGSKMMMFTRDRQCLTLELNTGVSEIGFVIGDQLESIINPLTSYIARHIKGSQDNAFYVGDGSQGWFRLNPNQPGASMSGEAAPIWSPQAKISGGCSALASIEVIPGVKLMFVGGVSGTAPLLNRDITVFSDNGSLYAWNATMGSIVLALPSKLAEVESIVTEMTATSGTQVGVSILFDEISGTFESLPNGVNDPPQLTASVSVLSNRFYLSQGTVPPLGRHIQVQVSGSNTVSTKDEVLNITLIGRLSEEQE